MRKSYLVIALGLCLALVPATLGCSGTPDSTTSSAGASTTLGALTTTTEKITTTTTTESPGSWTQLVAQNAPEDLPGARMGATLAFLPLEDGLLMFGGWDGTQFFGSVWSYDLKNTTWTDLDVGGNTPVARAFHSMVYLPDTGRLLVFGGYDGSGYLGDTWAYDILANTWTNLAPTGSVPEARSGASMVYDPAKNKVYLFGGWNGAREFNDTWAYSPAVNIWTKLDPAGGVPPARDSQAMAFEAKSGKVILYGGWNQTTGFADTWMYDPAANTWASLSPDGEGPSSRALPQMWCEPRAGKVVLFGGSTIGNVAADDMWAYDPVANAWAQLPPGSIVPAARFGSALAYDSNKGRLLLFGGAGAGVFFSDVWEYLR